MTEHWMPRNIGVEVPPTKLRTYDPVYDPLIRPTPAQLVALVSDVVMMGHTRKMGVFRPVFETLSTLGLELDGADPVQFLEFPEIERDIVIVLGFDCDAITYPSRDITTNADGQRDFIEQHRAEPSVILDVSVGGVFDRDREAGSDAVAGTTLHLADDITMFDFLLPLSPYAITAFEYPTFREWSMSTLIGYTQAVLDILAALGMERLLGGEAKGTPDMPADLQRDFERTCTLTAQAHQELTHRF